MLNLSFVFSASKWELNCVLGRDRWDLFDHLPYVRGIQGMGSLHDDKWRCGIYIKYSIRAFNFGKHLIHYPNKAQFALQFRKALLQRIFACIKEDAKSGCEVSTHIGARTHTRTCTKACDNFSSFTVWTAHSYSLQLTCSIYIMLMSIIYGWWTCLQPGSLSKISKYVHKYLQINISFAQKYNKLHS